MLRSERVARLGLLDDHDHPRVLPVTFALVENAIYTAIDSKPKTVAEPARVRYLRRRPEAALTVDRYDDDWTKLAWVQVLGRVQVIGAEAARAAMEALTAKYEPYRADPPPGPLLKLTPERILQWRASD